ncbi:MAG: hypothetical protein O7B25_03465 [Gammaproteobacteria bacterium]|nr:hypothetical protein [Gammaproteobacteria bacterium]
MKYFGLCVLALLLTLHAPVRAQSVSAWDLVHPTDFNWQIKSHRQLVAKDLSSRVRLLAAVVPAQSKEQQQQLKATIATLDALGDDASPRQRSNLYLSRAFQHRRLLDLLANTLSSLNCTRADQDINKEMLCWAEVSVYLMDEETVDIALTVLRSARMIPRDEDMPVKAQDPKIWYSEYGRGIVRYIIKPYLRTLSSESE